MANPKIIMALDYDGVIMDTKDEKLFSGFNTYIKVNPNTKLFNNQALTFKNFKIKKTRFHNEVAFFFKMLDFIGPAGENACVFELIDESRLINNYNDYQRFIKDIDINRYKNYHSEILLLRKYYYENFKNAYMKLSKPFSDVINPIKNLNDNVIPIICTLKPIENVVSLNEHFGITNLFKKILNVDKHGKKIKALENFGETLLIDSNNIFFVDDHISNFNDSEDSNIKCYLAKWGYSCKSNIFEKKFDNVKDLYMKDFAFFIDYISNYN